MKNLTQIPLMQKGFSLLTGFIVVIILFSSLAFFLAGQGISSGFSSSYTNQAKASGLLTSAGYISAGFDALTLGGVSASNVTFDQTSGTGVFDPVSGGTTLQAVDPGLLARTSAGVDGIWVYRKTAITMYGVGNGATADYTMMVSGLKKAICQQINASLHGTALNATPPDTATADAGVIGTPTVSSGILGTNTGNALNLNTAAIAGTQGWTSGCFATTTAVGSDVNYVYIHTLLAQ